MADNMAASTNGMGEEDQQQARATASTSPSAITTRKGKQAFENIYVQPTPTAYYRELNSLGYGLYHDTLEAFVRPLAATLAAETGSTRYVDVGCSYGNTAMGLLYGLNWAGVHSAWEASAEAVNTGVMPSEPFLSSMVLGGQVDKDSVHATGVDISAEALEYTRSTLGLYQSTFVQDFNADTIDPDLAHTLESADVMSCLMCVTYMRDGVLERLVTEQFLGDRSKTKHLVYNHNCAFDDRDMHPSTLFRNLPNWTHRQKFSISRKMTEVEQETRSGAADAWNFLYHVTFEPIAA